MTRKTPNNGNSEEGACESTPNLSRAQVGRFKEVARSLGCDEDKARFDAALEKVATHKPEAQAKPATAKSPKKSPRPA